MVQVRLKAVSKKFGQVTAVRGISFTARSGELLTLVGPSGCGKTTTLRLIAGFISPDQGDILFNKKSVLSKSPNERDVGMVFQNYALFPHLKVAKNIGYGLKFTNLSKEEKRIKISRLLELVNLQGMEDRAPDELSAGQRQRVALARALAPEPSLLLLDEPLSALDANLREQLRVEIKQIQETLKTTTVYVTHDQEEALIISNKIGVMHEGRIEQVGEPPELYNRPATEFVARFIGRGNLLTGWVKEVKKNSLSVEIAPDQPPISLPLAENKAGYELDQKVSFLIRPENLALNGKLPNQLTATIRSLEYLGDAFRIHLDYGPGKLIVKELETKLALLKPNKKVKVSFSPTDCYLL